ncbi:fibronectin type III domain-containing protein [Paenibacillus sp. 598K]|uniref:fibronectin type III domain-containing protein n=1 Tax=Paenibacillus sp. 598K TaxID=1117987 RepID=UPI0021A9DA15|nr:fibronectin type III domain-containing protein [Paenibacillus sp. 598K]
MIKGLALAAALVLLPTGWQPLLEASGSTAPAYRWDNVAIGGGGYVTGLAIHPETPDLVYARTDVGGAYRWDPLTQSWIQLLNSISYEDKNLYGIDAIAVDPSDDQVIYAAAGMYNNGATPSDVLKSTDRGTTWSRTNLNKPFAANGNLERSYGEAIAVHPSDSNQLLVGTRNDGIWKSVNGASRTDGTGSATDVNNWTQATGIPLDTEGRGVRSIVYKDAATVYAGVPGYGVYESTDGGSSWTHMPASPVHPRRLQLSTDGSVMYATHSAGVAKYKAGVWSNITPPTSQHLNTSSASTNYNGLTVDPADADHLIAARRAGSVPEDMFRSTDGGATWSNMNRSFQVNHSSPWWNPGYLAGALSSILFDPHVPGRVWMSDWLGIYRTEDVAQSKVIWTTYTKGHEEMVGFDLISPPTGAPLLAAYADNDGMRHDDLTQFPLKKFGHPALSETTALDYVEADPNEMVRVGGYSHGARGGGASSSDGGLTWTEFGDFPKDAVGVKLPHGNVAVSATNPELIVTLPINSPPMRSDDGGQTWAAGVGTPDKIKLSFWNWSQVIAADKIEGEVFYLYHAGKFYRSDDGGIEWAVTHANLPTTGAGYVKAAPGQAGEVWVSLSTHGLYRTTDRGATFSKLANVQEALLFGFGKAAPGTNTSAVYLYGKANGATRMGIYRSDDSGATWTRINDDQHLIGGNPRDMEGDRQVYGRVYVATDGTGVWYGEPAAAAAPDTVAPVSPTALSATPNLDGTVTLSWSPPADPDILHYVIYDGNERLRLASGDAASATIADIQPGRTYHFSIVARDTSWQASAASATVCYTAS